MISVRRLVALAMLFTAQLNGPTRAQTTRASDAIDVDGNGVGRAIVDWPREQRVQFGVWVVRNDWKTIAHQWTLQDRGFARDGATRVMRGRFDKTPVTIKQRTGPTSVRYDLTSAEAIDDLTGLFWFFGLPTDDFASGSVRIGEREIALPADAPKDVFLGEATADRATFTSRDGTRRVEVRFSAPRAIRVQDSRPYGSPLVQLYTSLHGGPIAAGTRASLDVSIGTSIVPSTRDATVTIDVSKKLNAFDGTGGNFVYSIDDPTTDLALREMRPAWARLGLEGREWTGDDAAAGIAAADVEGSMLRKRFELAKRLNVITDGRLILSLWYPPEQLFAEPAGYREHAGKIPRERWPVLADVVVAYLRHMKVRYGVEPRFFSFNESDLGVYVLLDGPETRDLTLLLGIRFRDAGLKTTILLGDSSDVAKGLDQIAPTLADTAARACVGALAYHPWSGQNEHWPRWAALAEQYRLPLLTAEMGSDPDGWRTGTYNAPLPTLRLGRRYVEQMRDARSRALLEWEWTGDYAITEKAADGTLRLTPRGELLRQLNRHTPANASIVATTCDDSAIEAAAMIGTSGVTVHLVNSDAERAVRIVGLPAGAMTLRVVDARAGEMPGVKVDIVDGRCTIVVPAGAIATLSNVE